MVYEMIVNTIDDLMQMLHTKKTESDDDKEKRHISVAYTLLEQVKAYIETYLAKES